MRKKIRFLVLLAASSYLLPACDSGAPDIAPRAQNIFVGYVRVQPVPNPEGNDTPTVSWVYGQAPQGGMLEMAKVAEDSFTRSGVSIMTETQIRMWVTDDRMLSGMLDDVCKTIMIDGQEIRTGSTIYGEITFTYKNDGRIIYVPPVL